MTQHQRLIGFFLFTLLVTSFSPAYGVEFLSLINKDCKVQSGFLIGNEDHILSLVNSEGKVQKIATSDVDQIVVHDLLEFPFSLQQLDSQVDWYEITLLDENRSVFRGMPVQFVDQLIFFLNEKGTIEVTPLQQIANLKRVPNRSVFWKGRSPTLDYSAARIRCPDLSASGSIPSRVLNDPIQVDEFLGNFETGFARFHQLNERMLFYARPMLVKNSVRMGIPVTPKTAESFESSIFNVKFSSGTPFGLQSSTSLLSSQNEWIPFYFPTNNASFEIKSHLFHAVLVTHIGSIAGGSSSFEGVLGSGTFNAPPGYHYDDNAPFILSTSYNYLTMFGIDIDQWSFSIGGYFPIEYVFFNNLNDRELLATSPQMTARVMFTTDKWRFRANGAKYDLSHTSTGNHPSLGGTNDFDPLTGVTGKTTGYFLRAGFDWDFYQNVEAKFDFIQDHWSYNESTGLNAMSSQNTYAAAISKDFGRYVSMKAYVAQTNYSWDGTSNGESFTAPLKKTFFGGEFEFIF